MNLDWDDQNDDGTDEFLPDWDRLIPMGPAPGARCERLTIALLEDLATLLQRHGYPPVRGYALAELTASLYRLAQEPG